MRTSTIIRALVGVLSVFLLGVLLLAGAPTLDSSAQAAPDSAPVACHAGVKLPFDYVISTPEAQSKPISAVLLDPQGCVQHARYHLVETWMHKSLMTLDFFPGQNVNTFTISESGRYRLVADYGYNRDHNASVTGLTPRFTDSHIMSARLASKVSVSLKHKHGHTYLVARARYFESQDGSWSELIDIPLKVQREVEGHWVKAGKTLSDKRFRLKHAGTYRVKVPETPFIWGTVSASITRK